MATAGSGREHRLVIAGSRIEGSKGTYEVVNPATEELVGEAPEASADDARAAVAAAREAFGSWSRTEPEERARLLEAAADLLEKRMDELVPLVQAETGATMRVASTMQVPVTADRFRRYARAARQPTRVPLLPEEADASALAPGGLVGGMALRQPVGVVACITPYNFPITNMAGKIAPALAMGNTVVVKPAPQDPLAVILLVELLEEVGFPPGVVNVVTGSGAEPAEALVESPDADMVSFTGSTAVGQRIAETAGRTVKRLLLELGGKGASLIFEDADLEAAIKGTGSTWMFHSGQICTAPTRAIVQRSVYDQVVEGLSQLAGFLEVGDPLEEDTVVGPLVSGAQRERVEAHIAAGRDEGGEVVVGGGRPAHMERGFYVEPTLVAGCRSGMQVVQEEIFGPVVVVVPFDDEEEGVALANDTRYGLYDYVWAGDTKRGLHVARQLRSGNVGLNTLQRNFEVPFGGTKQSGMGRDSGVFALQEYSELQGVVWPG